MSDDPVQDENEAARSVPSDVVRMRMRLSIEVDYELPIERAEEIIGAGLAKKIIGVFENGLDFDGAKKLNAAVGVDSFEKLDDEG